MVAFLVDYGVSFWYSLSFFLLDTRLMFGFACVYDMRKTQRKVMRSGSCTNLALQGFSFRDFSDQSAAFLFPYLMYAGQRVQCMIRRISKTCAFRLTKLIYCAAIPRRFQSELLSRDKVLLLSILRYRPGRSFRYLSIRRRRLRCRVKAQVPPTATSEQIPSRVRGSD